MKYSKVIINTDISDELTAQYICFLAKDITLNRFAKGNYYVLPHLENRNFTTVYFPDLPYSRDFWRTINFCPNSDLSRAYPKNATLEVKQLLKTQTYSYQKESEKIAQDWQKMEKSFFTDVVKFLDLNEALEKVNSIQVLITPFGSLGSFNPPRVGNNFNLIVTSRVDFPAGNIGACILQNLYIIQNKIGGEIGSDKYIKRMSAISFLFKNTYFSKYYPEFKDPNSDRAQTPLSLIKQSEKYLTKLGFPQKEIDLGKSEGLFSPQEENLLRTLQENAGKVVDFDKVATILWGEDSYDKYSPAAMAKVIENLRRKIKDQGINREVIFTQRGKGYFYS